ncbi:MAG TPA: DMT family transporter [Afifellaceae bacterium]|nr:DMT family transporter [Afifellaceae bacterium]
MPIYELSALAAAVCWALTSMISAGPAQHLGAVRFNQLRMCMVSVLLGAYVLATGSWSTMDSAHAGAILASGFVGIFLGDTALFLALNRLGPRRTGILFSMNAPIAALLGWFWLGETLSVRATAGIVLAVTGVTLAIAFGKRRDQLHQWESVKGPLWIGVSLGLLAALSQALGSLIARPVMEAGADPVTASAMRIGVAALCLTLLVRLPLKGMRQPNPLTLPVAGWVALSAFLGMAVGMTLILFALSGGEVGIVSTLSATTPALLLPLLWLRTREMPAAGAWFGAALAVTGSGLIFSG